MRKDPFIKKMETRLKKAFDDFFKEVHGIDDVDAAMQKHFDDERRSLRYPDENGLTPEVSHFTFLRLLEEDAR